MTSKVLTRIIIELPAGNDSINPYKWRIFDADNGKQIITLTEIHIWANADGLLWAEGLFLGDVREEFSVAGFRIRSDGT